MTKKMLQKMLIASLIGYLVACANPVRTLTKQQLIEDKAAFAQEYEDDLNVMAKKSQVRLATEYHHQAQQSYDILVLSGGGAYGAFGAGFLKGWGNVSDSELARPDFDSVSGISTGALIAPFAFVGTEESYEQIVNLYRNPDKGMVVPRSIISFLTGSQAYYDARVLHKRINESITPSLVNTISEKGSKNSTLIVGATNLDYGVMRVWDLSEIAKTQDSQNARKDITQKLIASSAIPSAFPPVTIDGHLYVDGGASMQVVSGIDDRSWLYEENSTSMEFVEANRPLRLRIWIIVNNKLVLDPDVVRNAWSSIATRSLVSLMRGSTLQTIQDIETFSHMINKRSDFDVEMRFVSIPQHFEIRTSDDLFDSQTMQELVELGEKMGADPKSWKSRALRPGASILKN
ncbi:patatin-like phospholipase family protein [Aliiglaciecola sp. M165]|uniref:patatin-like phospholipase family protein n=1 Tax=Aliiglaciecola sp. M165 TaxID=2593649 RepID=UPI00117FC156|nr:patatin-like phospholipase family protein [Aliiglaciecola sp. M165]TRY29223.1 patatin-like phospholipase family protein [Aliiglaciecola sp. M165]